LTIAGVDSFSQRLKGLCVATLDLRKSGLELLGPLGDHLLEMTAIQLPRAGETLGVYAEAGRHKCIERF
jgi:hypothetical protein